MTTNESMSIRVSDERLRELAQIVANAVRAIESGIEIDESNLSDCDRRMLALARTTVDSNKKAKALVSAAIAYAPNVVDARHNSRAITDVARKKSNAANNGPETSGPDLEWAVANPSPDPAVVAAREREEAFQDGIDDLIESRRESIERGDGESLLEALLDFCLNSDREMPLWLRERTSDAIRRYLKLHARTLDEAFRLKPRTGFIAKSRRARYGLRIYFDICALHWAGASITQELYLAVAELHNVGRNFVEECYSRELARRGGRRIGAPRAPEDLPKRLWSTFERVTGKRIEIRL